MQQRNINYVRTLITGKYIRILHFKIGYRNLLKLDMTYCKIKGLERSDCSSFGFYQLQFSFTYQDCQAFIWRLKFIFTVCPFSVMLLHFLTFQYENDRDKTGSQRCVAQVFLLEIAILIIFEIHWTWASINLKGFNFNWDLQIQIENWQLEIWIFEEKIGNL